MTLMWRDCGRSRMRTAIRYASTLELILRSELRSGLQPRMVIIFRYYSSTFLDKNLLRFILFVVPSCLACKPRRERNAPGL
jgi:hypothetical protein